MRKLLKEEGLSEIENELTKLNDKYSGSKQERPSETSVQVLKKEFSRLETFGHDEALSPIP